MRITQQQIQKIIEKAIDELYLKDASILLKEYDIHERTITHRLAMYLDSLFMDKSYNVDVEYNRMRDRYGDGDDVGNLMGKRLKWENSGEGSDYVYPDIIVHKRDSNQNLVEIEVKMAWKNRKCDLDYTKINEYMEQLGYQFGIYIELAEKREKCKIEFGPFDK